MTTHEKCVRLEKELAFICICVQHREGLRDVIRFAQWWWRENRRVRNSVNAKMKKKMKVFLQFFQK